MEKNKQEILNIMTSVINALSNVQVMPGKENWLNQGGAIAMLEDVRSRIDAGLTDKPEQEEEKQ